MSVVVLVWNKIAFNELSVSMFMDDSDTYANDVKTDDQIDEDEDKDAEEDTGEEPVEEGESDGTEE